MVFSTSFACVSLDFLFILVLLKLKAMPKYVVFFLVILICRFAIASPRVPIGIWRFQKQYSLNYLRIAESVPVADKRPPARVKVLRSEGFQCIHKSVDEYLCTKFLREANLTASQEEFLRKRFDGFQIEFLPTQNQPLLSFDGSTQTDYFMAQDVKFAEAQFSRYGITVLNSGEVYFKFVSDSQGARYVIQQFGEIFALPMILQTKNEMQTWGYYLNVLFELKH